MTEYRTMIRDLPMDQRPRERLLSSGASTLSDGDLLAILFRAGSAQESVVHLAERVLAEFGGLKGIVQSGPDDLVRVKGIGPAKAAELLAALELGRRLAVFTETRKTIISSPQDVYNLVGPEMRYLPQEQFRTLSLTTRNGVIRSRTVTQGSLNASIVEAREVFRDAISCNAASIIAVHNHPSGDPTPSNEDVSLTKRLVSAGEIIGVPVLDHLVIGDGNFTSLKERGLM